MIIKVSSLPSKGLNCPITSINIEPVTYYEIIKYTSKSFSNPMDKLVWDIEKLIMPIYGWESLSSFDLKPLIFTRKYLSATEGTSVNVIIDKVKYNLDVSKIDYLDIPVELTSISGITIAGQYLRFSVPSIKRYYDTMKELCVIDPNMTTELALIVASLREDSPVQRIIDLLNRVKRDEIVLLDYISTLLNKVCKPIELEGGTVINNLDALITDLFRFILINNKFDKSKIKIIENMES